MMNHDQETDFVRGIYTTASTEKALGQKVDSTSVHYWSTLCQLSRYDFSKDQIYRYHSAVQYDEGVV